MGKTGSPAAECASVVGVVRGRRPLGVIEDQLEGLGHPPNPHPTEQAWISGMGGVCVAELLGLRTCAPIIIGSICEIIRVDTQNTHPSEGV